jgi:hypothetical protein
VADRTIGAAGGQEAFLAPSFAAADLDEEGTAGELLRGKVARRLSVKEGEFHSLGLVLGYDYPDSPVVVSDGRPVPDAELVAYRPSAHPGARLPHAWLSDGTSLFDRLGDGFTLLRMAEDGVPAEVTAEAADLGVPLTVVDLTAHPELRDRYGADLVLVRPDQHVAWRGTSAGSALLARVTGGAAVTAGTPAP